MAGLRAQPAHAIGEHALAEGYAATDVEGLRLFRRSEPGARAPAADEPTLVLFAQGRMRISLGKSTYVCDGAHLLLTPVDLPVLSGVLEAARGQVPASAGSGD